MDSEDRPAEAEAWSRTCGECGKPFLQPARGKPRLICYELACTRARANRYHRQAVAAARRERMISPPYEGVADRVEPVVVAAAPTPPRRQGTPTERQHPYEERRAAALAELTRVATNLWITQRFNARDRSKFDYKAGFEQLLDEVLSVVQVINNAEEMDPRSRR